MNWLFEASSEGYASDALGEMPRSCELGNGYCAARDGRDNLMYTLECAHFEERRPCLLRMGVNRAHYIFLGLEASREAVRSFSSTRTSLLAI